MRTSIWYRNEERRPAVSGRYLCHRGFGMGGMSDSDHELGYLYYNAKKKRWQQYDYDDEQYVIYTVYYWTDVDTNKWIAEDGPSVTIRRRLKDPHPALAEAWQAVEEALQRYQVIEELTKVTLADSR